MSQILNAVRRRSGGGRRGWRWRALAVVHRVGRVALKTGTLRRVRRQRRAAWLRRALRIVGRVVGQGHLRRQRRLRLREAQAEETQLVEAQAHHGPLRPELGGLRERHRRHSTAAVGSVGPAVHGRHGRRRHGRVEETERRVELVDARRNASVDGSRLRLPQAQVEAHAEGAAGFLRQQRRVHLRDTVRKETQRITHVLLLLVLLLLVLLMLVMKVVVAQHSLHWVATVGRKMGKHVSRMSNQQKRQPNEVLPPLKTTPKTIYLFLTQRKGPRSKQLGGRPPGRGDGSWWERGKI